MIEMIQNSLNDWCSEHGEKPMALIVTSQVRDLMTRELFGESSNRAFTFMGLYVVVMPHLIADGEEFRLMSRIEIEQEIFRERKDMFMKTFNETFNRDFQM